MTKATQGITVSLTREDRALIEGAAEIVGETVEEFMVRAARSRARLIGAREPKPPGHPPDGLCRGNPCEYCGKVSHDESPGHNRFEQVEKFSLSFAPKGQELRLRDCPMVRASDYDALYEAAEGLAKAVDKWRRSFTTPDNIGPDDDELVAALAAFKGESNA